MICFEKLKIAIPELNKSQIEKLSDISAELGFICIATVVLPAVFEKFNPVTGLIGLTLAIIFWLYSLWLRR